MLGYACIAGGNCWFLPSTQRLTESQLRWAFTTKFLHSDIRSAMWNFGYHFTTAILTKTLIPDLYIVNTPEKVFSIDANQVLN